jgi:hypothetical protein
MEKFCLTRVQISATITLYKGVLDGTRFFIGIAAGRQTS